MDEVDDPSAFAFAFFEVVVVDDHESDAFGREGAVLGRAVGDDPVPSYAVSLDHDDRTWMFLESQLRSTGRHRRREDLFSGESIRVKPDADPLG